MPNVHSSSTLHANVILGIIQENAFVPATYIVNVIFGHNLNVYDSTTVLPYSKMVLPGTIGEVLGV